MTTVAPSCHPPSPSDYNIFQTIKNTVWASFVWVSLQGHSIQSSPDWPVHPDTGTRPSRILVPYGWRWRLSALLCHDQPIWGHTHTWSFQKLCENHTRHATFIEAPRRHSRCTSWNWHPVSPKISKIRSKFYFIFILHLNPHQTGCRQFTRAYNLLYVLLNHFLI